VKKFLFSAVIAAGVLAVPGMAAADTYDGSTCSYAADEQVSVPAGPAVVYADASGNDGGMTGTATASAGVCANGVAPAAGADGGTLEAGAGTPSGGPGAYAVLDGDNNNIDPLDGYQGLSNYETGAKGTCDSPPGSGSNSGGCLGVDGGPSVALPSPWACGNSSGNTWANTTRDGCSIP
jgi:hypothetical protein